MAFESYPGVCLSCGFLCQRDADGEDTGYYEVPPADREAGTVGHPFPRPTLIWCFVAAANLRQEIEELGNERPVQERTTHVIRRNRGLNGCPQWIRHKEGLSPHDHYAGLAMQELERRQYDFQERMEQRRQEFEARLERERRIFDIRITAVIVLFAMAEIGATVASVIIGR